MLFDFSGTLFRLEEDDSWFEGMEVDERAGRRPCPGRTDAPADRADRPVRRHDPEAYHAWVNRDLAPHLHREAYLHVLRESGLADHHAESLYQRVIDPSCWTPYPDTADVLKGLHRQGIKTAVVSNISFDLRPAFGAIGVADGVDEFVLSFEVGAVKPDAAIFETALSRLGVAAAHAVMVGDSEEADGGARAVGLRVRPRRPAADGAAPRRVAERAGRVRRGGVTGAVRIPGGSHAGVPLRPDHVASAICPTASASGRRGG